MLWTRPKSQPSTPASPRLVGVDLNSSRALAVTASSGTAKPIALFERSDELPLTVNLDTHRVGPVASRKSPHLACTNYLSQLGLSREWRGPRFSLTPETAVLATFEALRTALAAVSGQCAIALPGYLTAPQVKAVRDLAAKAKLTITGSATSALAIAAHRAEAFLAAPSTSEKPEWVVPLHPHESGPGVVLIVEVDEAALSATAMQIDDRETRVLATAAWPQASMKLWKERLLDAISDRCVRLCRRDPRDSADAEQGLYDQLEDALARSRSGATVTLAARADRWYQDLPLTTVDFESFGQKLANEVLKEVRDLVASLPLPPNAVWMSQAASVLPGLASLLYENSAEGTDVAVLPRDAAAEAAAALDARIRSGSVSGEHCDETISAQPRVAKMAPALHHG